MEIKIYCNTPFASRIKGLGLNDDRVLEIYISLVVLTGSFHLEHFELAANLHVQGDNCRSKIQDPASTKVTPKVHICYLRAYLV